MPTVRPARPRDAQSIRRVHLSAFPTSVEADLVEELQKDGDAVLSLVAESGDRIVGHILLSRMAVNAGGRELRALALAPIAVTSEEQGRGVGSALITEAMVQARRSGEEMIFVLGEPDYYRRFGFTPQAAAPFRSPYAGPYLMALSFDQSEPASDGTATHAAAFARLE